MVHTGRTKMETSLKVKHCAICKGLNEPIWRRMLGRYGYHCRCGYWG